MHKTYRLSLLTGAALGALAMPALAQTDPRVTLLEQQLRDIRAELDNLKTAQDNAGKAASQAADLGRQIAAQPKVTNPNGRFTFTSADGDFSISLRALVQFDMGYFSQGRNPASV